MANSLEFKISADDQASRVVDTVQNKIQNFGKDIAKMALGFAGPYALVQAAFGYIADKYQEAKKQAEDMKNLVANAAGTDELAKQRQLHSELNVELRKEFETLAAIQKLKSDSAKKEQENIIISQQLTQRFLETDPEGQDILRRESSRRGSKAGRRVTVGAENLSKELSIQEEIAKIQEKRNQLDDTKLLKDSIKIQKEQEFLKLLQAGMVTQEERDKADLQAQSLKIKLAHDNLTIALKAEEAAKRKLEITQKELRVSGLTTLAEAELGIAGKTNPNAMKSYQDETAKMISRIEDQYRAAQENTKAIENNTKAIEGKTSLEEDIWNSLTTRGFSAGDTNFADPNARF